MSRDSLIKYRRGTAIQWATTNPVLASGEPGFETDTLKFKVGDGTTAWNSLNYVGFDAGNIDPTCFTVATAVGLNVNLQISDQKEDRVGVSIKFADVEGGGITTACQLFNYSNISLPQYFYIENTVAAFSINTTATFLGGVVIKFVMPQGVDFSSLRVFKYSSGTTTDVTILNSSSPGWNGGANAPEPNTRTLYAYVTSFSEFYIVSSPNQNSGHGQCYSNLQCAGWFENENCICNAGSCDCSGSSSSSPFPTATPVPTSTASPVPTSTATPAPTSTATPAPTSTATPAPTSTAVPTSSSSSSSSAYSQLRSNKNTKITYF